MLRIFKRELKKSELVLEMEQYLKDTDWTITKINEFKLTGDDELVKAYILKYASILDKRNKAREIINANA